MKSKNDSANDIISELKRKRKFTEDNIVLLICVYFACYCDIPINGEIDFMYLKYKIDDKFKSNEIAKAYKNLVDYFLKTQYTFEFDELAFCDCEKKEVCKEKIECLIKELESFPNYYVTETTKTLNSLCINLLKPRFGSFYDGAFGLGEAIAEAWDFSDKLEIYGQENGVVFYSLGILKMFLHKIDTKNVFWGDTIEEPILQSEKDKMKKFDFSVMFPPLNVKMKYYENEIEFDKYNRFLPVRYTSLTMEWFFVLHQIATLKEEGVGVAVVPSGCLYNGVSEYIRKQLIKDDVIECIISLPQNVLTHTTVPMNLVILRKNKKEKNTILFIRGEEIFQKYRADYKKTSKTIIDEIVRIYDNSDEISGISKKTDTKNLENFVLLPARYVDKPIKTEMYGLISVEEPKQGEWAKLKDIGEFYRGVNITASSKSQNLVKYKVVNYTDVQNGELNEENVSAFLLNSNSNYEKNALCKDDILISCKGTSIKICIVPKLEEKLILSVNFIGIHIDKEKYDPKFVKYYLESPVGQSYLAKRQIGTSIYMLSAKDLEELPIPDIPLVYQKEQVIKLEEREEEIKKQIEELKEKSIMAKWTFYEKTGLTKFIKKK